MDTKKYKDLTGITVDSSDEAAFKASVRRTKARLETLLGFTLNPENLYNELGKARLERAYPNVDISNLLPPDEEQGVYKLFDYNADDQYLHVDPFTNIYSVKLVMPQRDGEFITVRTFDNVTPVYGRDGIGKFIEKYPYWFEGYRHFDKGLQLAVEADWMDCYPDDIMYLWADMIGYSLDPNSELKSESVDGHSWSKSDTKRPEEKGLSNALLKRYAGPHGQVAGMPV